MTYATVSDVAAELGRPTPTDTDTLAQWGRWLARAESAILARIPDLTDRIVAGTVDITTVADVEASAVARVVRNPEGLRQVSKTIDDGTVSKTRDTVLSDGQLRITSEEWARLIPPSTIFSIRGSHEPDVPTIPWPGVL